MSTSKNGKPEYTEAMKLDHRIRLIRKTAKRSGYRVHIPKNSNAADIDKAAVELSKIISEESL